MISAPDSLVKTRFTRFVLAVLAVFVLLAPVAHAQEFPKLTGSVVDAADILSPEQEASITARLASLEQASQRQLVVVTIADLQGYDIADYGFRLGDHWGIGDKERDDGALFIIAPNERKVRIEVGYGLEGVLPDILAGRIIRDGIIPHFKANDYPGGIAVGVDQISKLLQLPPEESRKLIEAAKRDQPDKKSKGEIIFVLIIIFFFFILPMLRGGRRGRAYAGGMAPVILWGPTIGGGRSSGGGFGGGFSGGGGGFGGGGASGGW